MRKLLACCVLLGLVSLKAALPNQTTWLIWWQCPTNMPPLSFYVPGTNQAYKIYGTSTLGTPMAQWPLLAVWTNWQVSADGKWFTNTVTVPTAQYFFHMEPTNTWGEASFGAWGQTGPMLSPPSIGLSGQ